ncbi:MAG: MauE/DoxX family redox-associated membrane protein [Candidatus Dormiibacterota bacterium]
MQYLSLGCAVVLAGVFLASGVSKLSNRPARRAFVESIRLLLGSVVRRPGLVAVVAVAAELGAVVLLGLPVSRSLGFGLAVAILLAYTCVLAISVQRGVEQPCRCFGTTSNRRIGREDLWRNGFLIFVGVLGYVSLHYSVSSALYPYWAAIAVGGGVLVAGLLVTIDDLLWLMGVAGGSGRVHNPSPTSQP